MRIAVNENIHLTEFRREDKAVCVGHLNDRHIYDCTLRVPHPYTDADFDKWMKHVGEATQKQGQPVHFAARNDREEVIGGIGFDELTIGKSHRAEIGYWMARPYWGKGYMTAVVRRACEFAFSEWGLVKISASVFPFNTASMRVLEKCGFVQEGYLRKQYLKDENYLDAIVLGLMR
jgi:ribosomal-protein-alanine N-acetyltransferase